ncbi:MAG: hypothetical protein AB7E95_10080 [Kiritimatiellales bacterium]
MKKTGWIRLFILAGIALTGFSETVYQDNFDGDGKQPLVGTVPDISTDGAAWIGSDQGAQWMSNGRMESAENQSCYVLLPFTPFAGKVYRLDVDVARIGTTHRFDAGFLSKEVPSGGSFTDVAGLASPWVRLQSNGEVWAMVSKSGGPGQLSKVNAARTHTLQIVLDTTGESWTAEWTLDGKSGVRHEYKKNPEIHYVGFGRFRQGTFHVSRLALTVTDTE